MSIIEPLMESTPDGAKLSRLFHASLQFRNAKNLERRFALRLAELMLCESSNDTCDCTRVFGWRVEPA